MMNSLLRMSTIALTVCIAGWNWQKHKRAGVAGHGVASRRMLFRVWPNLLRLLDMAKTDCNQ